MAEAAWALVQVAARSARAAEELREVDAVLGPDLVARVRAGESVRIEGEAIARARESVHGADELVGHAGSLLARVGVEDVVVDLEAARAGAAADLVGPGILDGERVLLAARLFDLQTGCATFAKALRSGDAHSLWEEVTVGSLIECFAGSSSVFAGEIAASAQTEPGSSFARLDDEQVGRLADALERFVDPDFGC